MTKQLVAVYGTLKKGYGNHRRIDSPTTKFIGEIKTPPIYTLYDGGYPAIEREGNTSIHCELYEVNDSQVLKQVYDLEGYSGTPGKHNDFYDVDKIPTPYGEAEIFVMPKGHSGRTKIIENGKWR
jgi:gamma-glutamylcyclotransferase (GGCT)/AIG2-like uncharacterized protein YtfP